MAKNLRPVIRFAEYTDDWEQRKLSLICDFEKGKGLNKDDIVDDGIYPCILYGQLFTEYGMFINEVQSRSNTIGNDYKLSEKGDILIPRCDTTPDGLGRASSLDLDNVILGFDINILKIRDKQKYDSKFISVALNHHKKELLSKVVGSTVRHLENKELKDISIEHPCSIKEQQMIGSLFQQLENAITLHQNKYDKIVSLRASMLEKLFVQEGDSLPQIRFGVYKAPWRKVRLDEIVVPYSDPVETPHDGYERLGIRSHGKGVFHDYVEAGKELGTAQMHRVASHNLIVNITFAWEHAVAITDDKDAGKLVSHRFPQFAMTDDIYDQFLKYMILDTRFRHHLLLSSPGGAGRNRVLKVPEMLEYEMMIPEVEEQRQIADYLNSLDELVDLYNVRVEKLKNIKMACLQKMFV